MKSSEKNQSLFAILIVGFSLSLFISSCKKDSSSSTTLPVISGYTGTDVSGNHTGPEDTTDWRTDDVWTQAEKNLFGSSNPTSNSTFSDSNLFVGAYPNPTNDHFSVSVGPIDMGTGDFYDSTITIQLLLVDQRFNVISNVTRVTNNVLFSLNTADTLQTDSIFRVYYKFTDKNNRVRCGHGDIVRR